MKYNLQVFDTDNKTLLYNVGIKDLFSALSIVVSGKYPNCNLQKRVDSIFPKFYDDYYENMQMGCKNGKTYGLD